MVKIYGLYNRPEVKGIEFVEPSMAQNQFLYEADLNNIVDSNFQFKDPSYVAKLKLAGKWSDAQPQYGDFTNVKSYQDALNIVNSANEQFSYLDAKVRDRFENNPYNMLDFCEKACTDASLYQEGVNLGLFNAPSVMPVVSGQTTESVSVSDSSAS